MIHTECNVDSFQQKFCRHGFEFKNDENASCPLLELGFMAPRVRPISHFCTLERGCLNMVRGVIPRSICCDTMSGHPVPCLSRRGALCPVPGCASASTGLPPGRDLVDGEPCAVKYNGHDPAEWDIAGLKARTERGHLPGSSCWSTNTVDISDYNLSPLMPTTGDAWG